jgi:hypothetical protein
MKGNQRFWRSVVAVMVVVVGLMVLTTIAFAQGGNPNPRVLPVHSSPFGSSYGEWSARWWQWVLSVPAATNPLFDTTGEHCAQGQTGKVWFLAGTFVGAVTRTCTVPQGKAVFFPILNATFGAAVFDCEPTNPGVPCDPNALRAAAEASMDSVTLEASIDGAPLLNLSDYRVQSPVFSVTVPDGNILGIPSGTYTPMVSDGYWLMLAPLSPGAHTIHLNGVVTGGVFNGLVSEVTYYLIVAK